MKYVTAAVIVTALATGALAAYVDTRPAWDDAGIMAGALFVAATALSFLRPRMAILIAIAIGGWIPLVEISRNSGSILALGVALIGALAGAALRWITARPIEFR